MLPELQSRERPVRASFVGTPYFLRAQVKGNAAGITVARDAQGRLASREESAALGAQVRLASGTIRSSLFAASDEARIPDAVAIQVAEIFADDIENEQSATNAAQGCNPNSVKQLTARTVRP
jgi:hypothetical protein